MDNPEFLWLILLAGYFLFQTFVKNFRKKGKDSQNQEGDSHPDSPWWEENWPSEPHWEEHEEEPSSQQEHTTDQPTTQRQQEVGKREHDRYRDVFTGRNQTERKSEKVSEKGDTDAQEYHLPSYERPGRADESESREYYRSESAYEREEKQAFERHSKKPYQKRKQNAWSKAEEKLYSWKQYGEKKRKYQPLPVDARQAVVHNAIFNRPYK